MPVRMERRGRLILSRRGALFFAFVFFVLSFPAHGDVVKGIYGVPSIKNVDPSSYVGKIEKAGINAVFVPPEEETVKWFKNRSFQVYVSVNAISYLLAQDPFQLSELADVISPMVYHRMCGRSEEWVGYMTQYYKETASSQVWPIVQSVEAQSGKRIEQSAEGMAQSEFGNAVRFAGQGGADGVLVYSFKGMKPNMWDCFREFHRLPNLMINSLAQRRSRNTGEGAEGMAHGAKREEDSSRITNQQITDHSAKRMAREVFSGEDYPLVEGKIRAKFGPYETKAFLSADLRRLEKENVSRKGAKAQREKRK